MRQRTRFLRFHPSLITRYWRWTSLFGKGKTAQDCTTIRSAIVPFAGGCLHLPESSPPDPDEPRLRGNLLTAVCPAISNNGALLDNKRLIKPGFVIRVCEEPNQDERHAAGYMSRLNRLFWGSRDTGVLPLMPK